jgi:molybdopterin converting factor small subunit
MGHVTAEKQHAQPITVKIVTMGAGITQYVADSSTTLGELLERLEASDLRLSEQMDIRVNGAAAAKDYRLRDGDQVMLVPKIRGGAGC